MIIIFLHIGMSVANYLGKLIPKGGKDENKS